MSAWQRAHLVVSALALALTAACGTYAVRHDAVQRGNIVGGVQAPEPLLPWSVTFVTDTNCTEVLCGGTLIGPGWVLTAAHCICDAGIASGSIASLGNTDGNCATTFVVDAVFPHPDFRRPGAVPNDSDIALVRLQEPFPPAADLPALSGIDLLAGTDLLFVGRGRDESGEDPLDLRAVLLTVQDDETCRNAFGPLFTSNMHCAGAGQPGDPAICGGDSGGPVLVLSAGAWSVAGASSFGGCNDTQHGYSVFTRIAPFQGWLQQTMAGNPTAAVCPSY